MNTLVDTAIKATCKNGYIVIYMESGVEIRFPISNNRRLAQGTNKQLNNIEISPYGLHWPDLDEDLSFRGLIEGDYGQYAGNRTSRCSQPPKAVAEVVIGVRQLSESFA
ncbi:MAG: DUF2442 domain-containing protein [Candidatus Desantisbacteria bacterium]